MSPPSIDGEGHAPPDAEASDSEYEYEEIIEEVEEEEVVYEEVEVEEEEEEQQEEEEEEVEEEEEEEGPAAQEDKKDLSWSLRSEENDRKWASHSFPMEKFHPSLPSNVHLEGKVSNFRTSISSYLPSGNLESRKPTEDGNDGVLQLQTENPYYSQECGGSKALCERDATNAETSNSPRFSGNKGSTLNSAHDHAGDVDIGAYNIAKEAKQRELDCRAESKQLESRLVDSEVASTSLATVVEFPKRNKRPAIICDFFAKGWCIRGNSCRFVHVKDDPENFSKQAEQDIAASNCKNDQQGEGLRDDKLRGPGNLERLASSDGNSEFPSNSSSSERILPRVSDESLHMHECHQNRCLASFDREDSSSGTPVDFQGTSSSKYAHILISKYGNVGRNSWGRNWLDDHRIHASPSSAVNSGGLSCSLFTGYGASPNSSVGHLSINGTQMPSSYGATLELKSGSQSRFNDNLLHSLRHPLNSSLNLAPFEAFNSLSSNASPLDARCLGTGYASMIQPSSPEKCTLPSANKRRKFTPYDWEPSVPFRPSFSLASIGIATPRSRYDPFEGSIEKPTAGDLPLRLSAGEGASFLKTSEQKISRDIGGNGTLYDNDGHSGTSHSRTNEQVVDRDTHSHGKDMFTAVAETAENSVVGCQNENVMLEERSKPLEPRGKDDMVVNGRKVDPHRSDLARFKRASKDDGVKTKGEINGMHDADADMQLASKAFKYFRLALIEFVKGLIRPTWHEGRLTKDEHNLIVKRAVDKVLSTLSSEQIPMTKESTKQYLSLSQMKIAKLVEGYVDKYGKSCEVRPKALSPTIFGDFAAL